MAAIHEEDVLGKAYDSRLMKRLLTYLRPYRWQVSLALASIVLKAGADVKLSVEHLAKPSVEPGGNPYHYVIVHVDGENISLEVVGVDWGRGFAPYRSARIDLSGRP